MVRRPSESRSTTGYSPSIPAFEGVLVIGEDRHKTDLPPPQAVEIANDRNRQKFRPGLIAYRDALDLIASVRPPRTCAGVAEARAAA